MSDVTQILERIESGDVSAADELLPIVYDQLRRLARKQLAGEAAGLSFQTTDLVHEAYLRLVGSDQDWKGQGHFVSAAAEAMRRILVERARKKRRIKHGGNYTSVDFSHAAARLVSSADEVIVVSDLLESLTEQHPLGAEIVKLHYFAGLNISEAGRALGMSSSAAHRHWTFARAWLYDAMRNESREHTS